MSDGDGERRVVRNTSAQSKSVFLPPTPVCPVEVKETREPLPNPSAAQIAAVRVSVVVPSYNRSDMLYRVLYSLWRQRDPNYEVLVSNDDDDTQYRKTARICWNFRKMGMPLRYFHTGKFKRGRGWSVETYPYNVGIRYATGSVIILNSGDVMSVTNTIGQHRQAHIFRGDKAYISTVHALTQVVQTKIETYDWKNNPMCLLFKGSCYKMFTGWGTSYTVAYTIEDAGAPYHFQMSINKAHLHRIRGFDEDFYGLMSCADDDIAHRLRKAGLKFECRPEALAIHQYHASPEFITKCVSSRPNPRAESGHTLYRQRLEKSVVRNIGHEWGQYPRNMAALPDMSGVEQS